MRLLRSRGGRAPSRLLRLDAAPGEVMVMIESQDCNQAQERLGKSPEPRVGVSGLSDELDFVG
jgi:hypothetical protein